MPSLPTWPGSVNLFPSPFAALEVECAQNTTKEPIRTETFLLAGRELEKWKSKWLFQLLSSRCSPEERKVPPTGSLSRFRAPVFLFHSLEQGKQSEASGDLLAAKQPL